MSDGYVHAYVELEGIGRVHCWAALAEVQGQLYLGYVQMEYPGAPFSDKDPETGRRTQLRRLFTEADEDILRDALKENVKQFYNQQKEK